MKSMLRNLRDLVQARPVPNRLRHIHGPELIVLTYHRVLPRSSEHWRTEQPGMLVAPQTLEMHLGTLGSLVEFVDLESWIRAAKEGDHLPRLACAVTFDDGWRDNYDHAFPVLKRLGVPATIFLVSDRIGSHYSFWPNRLAHALASLRELRQIEDWPEPLTRAIGPNAVRSDLLRGRVEPATLNRAIEAAKSLPDEQLDRLLDEVESGRVDAGPGRDLLDWEEVREMRASGLVSFGSHTRHHVRLVPALEEAVMTDEIAGSADVIEGQLGQKPALFCYPNGDYCETATRVVSRCYLGAVSTHTGWHTPDSPVMAIRRVGLHEDVTSTRSGLLRKIWRGRQLAA